MDNIAVPTEDMWNFNLDYNGENNLASFFNSNGNIHPYPAKAVPEVVNFLLSKISEITNIKTVLDPFVGSGTVALESKYLGYDFYGSDLNPLSILISKTKSLTVSNALYIEKKIRNFTNTLLEEYLSNTITKIESFDNINFWFKEENIRQLSFIKYRINVFLKRTTKKHRETFALILLTAFSSAIRFSSLTRNSEFKLYRMSPADIKNHNVNSVELYKTKVLELLDMLEHANEAYSKDTLTEIVLQNAKSLTYLPDKKVDVVITSPPYGDSQSTVAYGQFSRLSLQWMSDLLYKYLNICVENKNCDSYLLGGKKSKVTVDLDTIIKNSHTASKLIDKMYGVIRSEAEILEKAVCDLEVHLQDLRSGKKTRVYNEVLLQLIQERVRLDVYRSVKSKGIFSDKRTKAIAKHASIVFMKELLSLNPKKRYRRLNQLSLKLPLIKEILMRKIKAHPKRVIEIINFFRDLYQVVVETDRVLADGGVQAWIVGHRTVLGKVTINLVSILQDWFESLGYTKITTLERQYSFKRLPHHINSTVTRHDEIKTMMQEHILVVKKAEQ